MIRIDQPSRAVNRNTRRMAALMLAEQTCNFCQSPDLTHAIMMVGKKCTELVFCCIECWPTAESELLSMRKIIHARAKH